jgi:23S rRNA pseudouridine1911/1915/1917 synthase
LGDPVYGIPSENQAKWKALPTEVQVSVKTLPGQALHARILGFVHPITKKELYFEAEPYPEFLQTLVTLRAFR